MPKYEGACPENNEVDVYTGCSFCCAYCIAGSRHSSQSRPVDNWQELLNRIAFLSAPCAPFYISPWTDAYQHLERREKRTRTLVELLATRHLPFFVVTKGDLVLRDIEFFTDRDNAFVGVSLNSLDDGLANRLEPEAPRPSLRVDLITELVSIGNVKTVVKIDPILPGITDGSRLEHLVAWLCRVRPDAVTVETARLTRIMAERLKPRLSKDEFARLMCRYPRLNDVPLHPNLAYRLDLFREVAARLERRGINACFCKASLPLTLTPNDCRGGY